MLELAVLGILHESPMHGYELRKQLVTQVGAFRAAISYGSLYPTLRRLQAEGWIAEGRAKLDRLRPIAERTDVTPMQLACQWNLAHEAVECVVPTLIQEAGEGARPIEEKRAELEALPGEQRLSPEDVAEVRAIGDNAGCMALKGASPDHSGDERPDRWPVTPELAEAGLRWGVEADTDLRESTVGASQ